MESKEILLYICMNKNINILFFTFSSIVGGGAGFRFGGKGTPALAHMAAALALAISSN